MIKSTHEMVFYMYYTVGWLSSNGNYSSENPANKLSGFVGALLSKEITIGKEGGPCRHFVVYVLIYLLLQCSPDGKYLNRAYRLIWDKEINESESSARSTRLKVCVCSVELSVYTIVLIVLFSDFCDLK